MNAGALAARFGSAGRDYWRASSPLQKLMFGSGSILFGAMLLHGVALIATGGSIHGPVSFRKAMTFAETGWLLSWAVGWLLPLIVMRRWERGFVAFGALLFALGETFVMSLQVWRGQPSHYNDTTPFDFALFGVSGIIAVVFMLSMLVLLRAAFRERDLQPSVLLSIRAGTIIMLVGVATGWIMSANSGGVWQGSAHLRDTMFDFEVREGAVGGDLVALHAIGVHGLSLVPLVAWLLSYSPLSEATRYRLTAMVVAAIALLLIVLGAFVFTATPWQSVGLVGIGWLGSVIAITLLLYAVVGWWAVRGVTGWKRENVRT
jgi:hypothetical protein